MDAKTILLALLGVIALAFAAYWIAAIAAARRSGGERVAPTPYELFVGLVTDFFDTLGIGSFATTTTLYRARRTIDDRLLPGTMNVGHALPTVVQAYIYTKVIDVEIRTLILMIAAAVAGSLIGAPIVARWPRRPIQIGLGLALLVLCTVLIVRQLNEPQSFDVPVLRDVAAFVRDHVVSAKGGDAIGLSGRDLVLGIAGNFALGALMTIGVGLYAPCLVMVSMLGMNPNTGFPIMMGSCAFLMPLASVPFIRQKSYSPSAAIGLTLAGIPAVIIAAKIVKSMDLYVVKWLVAIVVVYTSITLLAAARRESGESGNEAGAT